MISLLTSTIKELVGKRPNREVSPVIERERPVEMPGLFEFGNDSRPMLQQERHEYNMEGLFSPHQLPLSSNEDLVWIGSNFLKKNADTWLAISAPKLLEYYTLKKLEKTSLSIPLLVSEPFPSKDVKQETLRRLIESGLELEYLGSETLVLRSIPEWMNGYPLKEVTLRLLHEKSFMDLEINPLDWSQSTWIEMLEAFPVDELTTKKVILDLSQLLRDKFR